MKPKVQQKIKYIAGVFFAAIYLLYSVPVFAASVSLRPLVAKVNLGASFTVSVDVNTQGKTINNAEAVITFPTDLVEVSSINSGGSIFTLWVEQPAFSNSSGLITFNGGVPNPGYTGSSGHILSIQFRSKASGTAVFSFASAAIRENDGLGTNIISGQTSASISITEQNTPATNLIETQTLSNSSQITNVEITSPTFPDSSKWYNQSSGIFSWKLPQGATASQTSLDKISGSLPRVLRKPAVSTISVDKIQEGVWYFKARFQNAGGWSKVFSYKIQVDTTPPDSVVIATSSGNIPVVSAHDALSGLDYFMAQIDSGQPVKIIPLGNETPINITGVSPGVHSVKITAYDLAGNPATASADVEFKQPQEARITNYSESIREGERISAYGTGPANSPINIVLISPDGIARTYTVNSASAGGFSFQSEPIAGIGFYDMRAQYIKLDGSLGAESVTVKISVIASAATKFGSVLKSVSRVVTASNIIIVILSILCILGWLNYFALKKNTKQKSQKRNSLRDSKQNSKI
jgi:hypothetical protein